MGEVFLFDARGREGDNPAAWKNSDLLDEARSGEDSGLWILDKQDPYADYAWLFEVALDRETFTAGIVLCVEHADLGAGALRVSLRHAESGAEAPQSRAHNFTRLNTMRDRTAWFGFDLSAWPEEKTSSAVIEITGLQALRNLTALPSLTEPEWEQAAASIPQQVTPMVFLENPMQLVTTAGADPRSGTQAFASSVAALREYVPLAKVLGFTSIESYVRWNWVEQEEGKFDWSLIDPQVAEMTRHGMKWFPLLVVGSAYALPSWYRNSKENIGFVCLEHGLENPIQTIWNPAQERHVTRFLTEFGKHYEPMGVLEGVRLGPSGNYGESQYPAGGNWAPPGEKAIHIHLGWWAGDDLAVADYREFVKERYRSVDKLNQVWGTEHSDWNSVKPRLPETMLSPRERLDFTEWYTDAMTEWCDWWVQESAKALPNTKIYQSAGGWGFREAGTDYPAQTKSMVPVRGGIRLTNETDSFEQNFFATRLAATAARLYGTDLGYEPASSHTARGIVGRIYNTATTHGDHLFTYQSNVFYNSMAIERWLKYVPLLDRREDPLVEVAVYYPETFNQIEDSGFRFLYAWGFNPRAREIRRVVDVDYLDERLIREGFLDRYKVLVHAWGDVMEADVMNLIDEWIARGGTYLYPSFPKGPLTTVENDAALYTKWQSGQTGQGTFARFRGDMEPPSEYGDFVRERLSATQSLDARTRALVAAERSEKVFASLQADGEVLLLNYADEPGTFRFPEGPEIMIEPYGIEITNLGPGK
jgi:hypothetical protein